jgi:hypothetical protein
MQKQGCKTLPELFIKTADPIISSQQTEFQAFPFYAASFFPLRASQSHRIGFIAAHSQYSNTASWATSLPLQQSWPVNNPG